MKCFWCVSNDLKLLGVDHNPRPKPLDCDPAKASLKVNETHPIALAGPQYREK